MELNASELSPNNALLLEDEPKDCLATRMHLELMGFVVYDTPSPIEAKEIFEQHDFSIVLLHLGFSSLAGLEVCRKIRSVSTVPILMFTARGELDDEQMVMSAGADDYITKPIESKILTSRITQQLKRGQSQRAPRSDWSHEGARHRSHRGFTRFTNPGEDPREWRPRSHRSHS